MASNVENNEDLRPKALPGVGPGRSSSWPGGGERIDAVLPATAKDFDRFRRVLVPSLRKFFAPLGTCHVVVPETDVSLFEGAVEDARFQVVSEVALIPELLDYRKILRRVGTSTGAGSGWFIQQLVKLSIARVVSTPFYLTLDADVICVKRVGIRDLVRDGRGIAVVYRSDSDVHGGWYWWTEKVLGFPRSGRTRGVTPALLSVEGVGQLCKFLQARVAHKGMTCEAYLLKKLPWTEYTLYYSFLEHMGLFDAYHFAAESALYENSVWHAKDFPGWDPQKSFHSERGFLFSVLQNDAVPSVDELVARIGPYLS